MPSTPDPRVARGAPRSLTGLLPFLRPYRGRIALAGAFLALAALATLAFPLALRNLLILIGGIVLLFLTNVKLALRKGVPLIPVAIVGAEETYPRLCLRWRWRLACSRRRAFTW